MNGLRDALAKGICSILKWGGCAIAVSAWGAAGEQPFEATGLLTIKITAPQHGEPRGQQQGPYFAATLTTPERAYTNVEIRLKGHGSYRPFSDRPNLAVRFVGADRFYGCKKILLNNSIQDGSLLRWKVASELFLKAGLPAARVNFVRLQLNGRDLGPYLVVEATNRDFLAQHFRSASGNLYEGSNHDVEDTLEQDAGNPSSDQADLRELAEACREPDLAKRWQLLRRCLDVEKFVAFAAIEVLICHRDGYSLDRNNFRIYHDPTSNKLVFIPHGMDLIFDNPTAPLEPQFRGTVARAMMEIPQGRQMYRRALKELGQLAYGTEELSVRASELERQLRAACVDEARKRSFDSSAAQLHECLRARRAFVLKQIAGM